MAQSSEKITNFLTHTSTIPTMKKTSQSLINTSEINLHAINIKTRDGNRTRDLLLGKEEKGGEYRLVVWCKGAWNVGSGIFMLNRFL